MPYIYDMDARCSKVYTMKVSPYGWINNPVEIEYGITVTSPTDPGKTMCMRVKGVPHVWADFEQVVNRNSKGNYERYFTGILEEFRLEFLMWVHTEDYWELPWFKEYYGMFKDRFYDFSDDELRQFEQARRDGNPFKDNGGQGPPGGDS
jgi:hypothetical protein